MEEATFSYISIFPVTERHKNISRTGEEGFSHSAPHLPIKQGEGNTTHLLISPTRKKTLLFLFGDIDRESSPFRPSLSPLATVGKGEREGEGEGMKIYNPAPPSLHTKSSPPLPSPNIRRNSFPFCDSQYGSRGIAFSFVSPPTPQKERKNAYRKTIPTAFYFPNIPTTSLSIAA